MKKTQFLVILVGVLFLLAAPAAATIWTDTYQDPDGPVYMTKDSEYSYRHDITDQFDTGFLGIGGDYIGWYQLELQMSDDPSLFNWGDNLDIGQRNEEWVSVSTGFWFEGDTRSYEVDFSNYFDPITHSEMSLKGYASLNAFGVLDVELTGLGGDFFFVASKLTASETAPVPEPGTIVLMGLGLVGLAGMGRKKLFKK